MRKKGKTGKTGKTKEKRKKSERRRVKRGREARERGEREECTRIAMHNVSSFEPRSLESQAAFNALRAASL